MYCEFRRKNIVRHGYNGINKNSNNLDNRIIGLLFFLLFRVVEVIVSFQHGFYRYVQT